MASSSFDVACLLTPSRPARSVVVVGAQGVGAVPLCPARRKKGAASLPTLPPGAMPPGVSVPTPTR